MKVFTISPIVCSNFYKLCLQVFNEVRLPMHNFYRSKKMYNNFAHCFLLVYKERLNVSYRRFVELASENHLQRMLCIKRIPHYTTLQKFMKKLDKKVLEKMIRACRKLLNLEKVECSIDATGFSNTNPSHYYQKTINNKTVKNYTKTVLLTDNKTKLVLNMRTSSDKKHEVRSFIPLVRDLKESISLVLADKAHDSRKAREYCWSNGIKVHIPLRKHKHSRRKYGLTPRKNKHRLKARKAFNSHEYSYRNLVESVNSAIKRTL